MTDERAPQAAASLDQRTLLVGGHGDYMTSLYPEAGEIVIVAMPSGNAPFDFADEQAGEASSSDDPELEPEPVERSEVEQAAHDQANWQRANSRATAESRRYLVANRLCFMWVLTYDGEGLHGPVGRNVCMHDVADFVRRFHNTFGDLPYWFSPELHPDGHGWHVNFFVPCRIDHAEMAKLWGHGYVWVKDWRKDSRIRRQGLSVIEAVRLAALYGCKYASKDWAPDVITKGRRRYSCAEGHRPIRAIKRFLSLTEAIAWVEHVFGQAAATSWCSLDDPDWTGPPVWCLRWSTGVDPPDTWQHGYG